MSMEEVLSPVALVFLLNSNGVHDKFSLNTNAVRAEETFCSFVRGISFMAIKRGCREINFHLTGIYVEPHSGNIIQERKIATQ